MVSENQPSTPTGENVIRKACVWRQCDKQKIAAPVGGKTKAQKALALAERNLAEAVDCHMKGHP